MKTKISLFIMWISILFAFSACVDKQAVRNEILSYHNCITICEERADEQMQQAMQEYRSCIYSCEFEARGSYHRCMPIPPPNMTVKECRDQVELNLTNCRNNCRLNDSGIKAERKRCKLACIPSTNPPK